MSPQRKHWLCWIKGGFFNRRDGMRSTLDILVGGEGKHYAQRLISNVRVCGQKGEYQQQKVKKKTE